MPTRIPITTNPPTDDDRSQTPASAARHGAQLVHAARVADELVRLVALSDEQDGDHASFIDALAAFDRWQRALRARHAA